jgi:NAD(P)-dependent dehydrogenase (short-subunit alcohol dehydrogenase family)
MRMMNHANQHGGHALVTGASSGIGVAIASRLLRDGWYVTGLDRTEPIINGPYFSPLMLDLSDADAVRCALCTLKVNDLVQAAGILRFGELGSLGFAAGPDMWRVNVAAAMLLDDSGANASSRGPHSADRQPYCFRVRRPQPVCRHQVGAYRDGTFVGDGARAPRPSPSMSYLRLRRKRLCCSIRPQQLRLVFLRSGVLCSRKKLRRPPRFSCPKRLQRSQARW